jgi:cytochrome b pre-mRNA-processing protein 3
MLWPFNRPKTRAKSRTGSPGTTIEAIYGMIVAQARLPVFYEDYGVPDTVNGRFDMIVLHLWMLLRRLRATEGSAVVSQGLFDRFCSDMDGNLREMGISDLKVPKQMLSFAEAFYGRTTAYDLAFAEGAGELANALARNVLITAETEKAAPLAAYAQATIRDLDGIDAEHLQSADWAFAAPVAHGRKQEPVS